MDVVSACFRILPNPLQSSAQWRHLSFAMQLLYPTRAVTWCLWISRLRIDSETPPDFQVHGTVVTFLAGKILISLTVSFEVSHTTYLKSIRVLRMRDDKAVLGAVEGIDLVHDFAQYILIVK